MRKRMGVIVWRFMLYAFMGLLLEVTMGAVLDLCRGQFNLRGSTSLWMILDYGLLGVLLMPIKAGLLKCRFPLLARGLVYMLGIYAVEYVSGTLFTAAGLHIWDYSDLSYNLQGQVALVYAPIWYLLGIAAELMFDRVDACAHVLAGAGR